MLLEGILIVLIFVVFIAITGFIPNRFVHYRLDEQGLSVDGDLWWRKPIPYWQIESAKVISWRDCFRLDREVGWLKTRSYTTRAFTRKYVAVRHRDGRVFVLTPDHPETFVRTLNDAIAGTALRTFSDPGRSSDLGLRENVPGHKARP